MTKALATIAGLAYLDPSKYGHAEDQGVDCCCIFDAYNMENLLDPLGFNINVWTTNDANEKNITDDLKHSAATLDQGDILVFYFSGHGGRKRDTTGEEPDKWDETICLFDRELSDDDFQKIWHGFKPGVRIVTIFDCCHSEVFDKILANPSPPIAPGPLPATDMKAQLIHLGACRNDQYGYGDKVGQVFTNALVKVWNDGAFNGSYEIFLNDIKTIVKGQEPVYREYGPLDKPFSGQEMFRRQKPFTI